MNAKVIAFTAVGALLLAALFVWLRPSGTGVPGAATPPASATTAPPKAAKPTPVEVAVDLELKGGKRTAGPEKIVATQGEILRLRVTADARDELHVHGYDFKAHLDPATPTELRFPLTTAGRFEIELHDSHGVVTVLEVQPKP